jgi:hypothetical protein
MNDRTNPVAQSPAPRGEAEHALVASGMWLRVGFVGASALAATLAMLFRGEAPALLTLATGFGGGVLAALAWRHARVVLDRQTPAVGSLAARVPRPVLTRYSSGY